MKTNINIDQDARRTDHARFSPRPLRERVTEGRVRGTEQGNNFIIYPSSVCWNFVPQTTSPARGEDKRQGGFTLIELLVVVLLIGILAAVAVPQYQKAVMKSRYSTLISIVDSLAQAEEAYYLANGTYADDFEALVLAPSGCTLSEDKKTCTYPWGYCALNATYNRVACINTQSLNNAYVHFLSNIENPRRCFSLSDTQNDKYGKLCENMGAIFMQKINLAGIKDVSYMYHF